jgi:hypothetical protein
MKVRVVAFMVFFSVCLSLQALPRIKFVTITVDKPVEYSYTNSATQEKTMYWVITARLENKTKRDRNVVLSVKLQSDVKRLDQEYEMITCTSFKAIHKKVEFNNDKKYYDYIDMSKKVFKKNEVRDMVFIFKRPSRHANKLTLLVEGLSDVKIQKIQAAPGNKDVLSLDKSANDFFSVATPRLLKFKNDKGKKVEERRLKKVSEKDFPTYEGKKVKSFLVYRRSFDWKGDAYHVHEDDIVKKKHEMNVWILVLDKVLNGFSESAK